MSIQQLIRSLLEHIKSGNSDEITRIVDDITPNETLIAAVCATDVNASTLELLCQRWASFEEFEWSSSDLLNSAVLEFTQATKSSAVLTHFLRKRQDQRLIDGEIVLQVLRFIMEAGNTHKILEFLSHPDVQSAFTCSSYVSGQIYVFHLDRVMPEAFSPIMVPKAVAVTVVRAIELHLIEPLQAMEALNQNAVHSITFLYRYRISPNNLSPEIDALSVRFLLDINWEMLKYFVLARRQSQKTMKGIWHVLRALPEVLFRNVMSFYRSPVDPAQIEDVISGSSCCANQILFGDCVCYRCALVLSPVTSSADDNEEHE